MSRTTVRPLSRLALAAALALSLVTAFLVAAPTAAHANPDTIVSLVNDARSDRGLRPMRVNSSLTSIAQDWSQRQAASQTMSHRPNFTSSYPSGWTRAAENVAWYSQDNPRAVFDGWMNSPGHRANILNPALTDIGVGWARAASGRYYATQNFAAYPGSTAAAPAAPAATVTPVTPPATSLGGHDYNGDGNTDVVAISGGRLHLYPGNGRNGWNRPTVVGSGWTGYTLIAPGDFNRDGRSDLVATSPAGQLLFFAGRSGGFASAVKIGHGWQGFVNVFSPGDFSGDGVPDILGTTANGDLYLYSGNGRGQIGASARIGFGWNVYPTIFGGGDFNGDRRMDIFARDSYGRLYAYYNRGGSSMSARVQIGNGWGAFRHLSSIGDFSGDGRTDVFGIDSRTGAAYLYPGTGWGTFKSRVKVGSGWGGFSDVI